MPKAVKISDELACIAAVFAGVEGRSLAGQVEYWAKLGRIADENPDLPVSLIKEIRLVKKMGHLPPEIMSQVARTLKLHYNL